MPTKDVHVFDKVYHVEMAVNVRMLVAIRIIKSLILLTMTTKMIENDDGDNSVDAGDETDDDYMD